MATTLTSAGIVWALLSLAAAVVSCLGFYLPFWIQALGPRPVAASRGVNHITARPAYQSAIQLWEVTSSSIGKKIVCLCVGRLMDKVDAYFSSFRRCNYPRVTSQGAVEIVLQCGRYSRFWDIPSPWWQASTVLVGLATALSLVASVTALSACFFAYVMHTTSAKVVGSLQLLAALLVSGGVAVYPVGWDNKEVRDCCGNTSHVYRLGTCQVSWSLYLLGVAVLLLLVCFVLSFGATRVKPG